MKLLLLSLLICVGAGCYRPSQVFNTDKPTDPKSYEEMVYIKPAHEGYKTAWSNEGLTVPNWINDPSMDGRYVAGVGSSFMQGLSYTEYKNNAYKYAIAEIGRSRKVKVKSVYKNYETGDGINYIEDTSKLESNEDISNAKIISTWVNPIRHEFYVWVVVQK